MVEVPECRIDPVPGCAGTGVNPAQPEKGRVGGGILVRDIGFRDIGDILEVYC
jgi:hypothetical protein